ncbi:helix-turn-helix domain-containing protein [Desulfoprunum benzoelyticum]|uniref:Helix-turn-helix domain-containing protein n=1 Tax=Desulfoprunum benzoelyticum TaxID=1506996 RepID=A0A840V363_9BACT|nr:helix-turn-helix domain-containing protein [Desulfoprunum benzoelyticum]MBB5348300.1 hypothetical protein [Desulfoprunum benzoelyticum]MBM9529509.1 helix-turn-helix domain-containing protein [Desulfoprunum benzoelyticum]
MTESGGKEQGPALKIEQVAILCGVSVSRVGNWIEKNGLKVVDHSENRKVRQEDLVEFLLHYNMPIPKGILPVNARKMLLIYSEGRGRGAIYSFLKTLSEKMGSKFRNITDSVTYGKSAEYKILNFVPDLVLVDAVHADDEALGVVRFVRSIGGMRSVVLVRRNMAVARRAELLRSGAHAVIERNTGWKEMLRCLERVLNSLGDTSK